VLSSLQLWQHLPLEAASKKLGIGVTQLKSRCRMMGIKKWPYRKLHSSQTLISALRQMVASQPAASGCEPLQVRLLSPGRLPCGPALGASRIHEEPGAHSFCLLP
jgi:hypothetical protein